MKNCWAIRLVNNLTRSNWCNLFLIKERDFWWRFFGVCVWQLPKTFLTACNIWWPCSHDDIRSIHLLITERSHEPREHEIRESFELLRKCLQCYWYITDYVNLQFVQCFKYCHRGIKNGRLKACIRKRSDKNFKAPDFWFGRRFLGGETGRWAHLYIGTEE